MPPRDPRPCPPPCPHPPRRYGCTALTWAARNGSADVLKFLLGKEGDVESVSYGGFKPVHHACNAGKEATLKEVIAAG